MTGVLQSPIWRQIEPHGVAVLRRGEQTATIPCTLQKTVNKVPSSCFTRSIDGFLLSHCHYRLRFQKQMLLW